MMKKICITFLTVALIIVMLSATVFAETTKETVLSKELLRSKGVVITAVGVSENDLYYNLKLKIENNSKKDIMVQTREETINGIVVSGYMSPSVASGKIAYEELSFYKRDMIDRDIFNVGTIDFDFHIVDDETWERIMDDTRVSVTVDGSVKQKVNSSGSELYNHDGVRIVLKGVKEDSSSYYEDVIFYIENNSSSTQCVQVRNCSVNDIMIDPMMSEVVPPGCKSFAEMSFDRSNLTEKGISSINKVELKFHVFDWSDWDQYYTSNTVTFYPKSYSRSGWIRDNSNWLYRDSKWRILSDEWAYIGSQWYYFDESGHMQHGWLEEAGNWYYLGWPNDPDSGAMRTGWVQDGGKWYYMNSSGAMQTGWIKDGNTWYYLRGSGEMAANEYVGGYWLNPNGSWTYPHKASWRRSGNRWWYGDTSGWYAKNGTYKIDGTVYTFDAAGWMK